MKRWKTVLITILCLVMAFGCLAGCNFGPVDNWDGTVDTDKDGQAWDGTEDENVTSINIFKNDWAEFNSAAQTNSPVYAKLKSVIGCDIEARNGSSNWQEQLGLLQSDNDLPDMFLTNGPDNPEFFSRLIRNGDIIAISDWVNAEHYPNIYKHMQEYNYIRYNLGYGQGKAWFIPSTWHNEKSMYVRQDWIDNLNAKLPWCLVQEGVIATEAECTAEVRAQWAYKLPTDLLEFYRLARAFTLYDPDGNGQADTRGYISESNQDFDAWVYTAFGAGWNQFVADGNGGYTYSDITDASMYATAYLTRLMTDGYMSPDSITADNGGKQDRFTTGKVGMIYAHNWLNNFVSGLMSVDKSLTIETATAKIAMIDPPAGPNGDWNGHGPTYFWQGFCINANMSKSRIRKCLELYDYLLSDEGYELLQYGVKDTHYSVDEASGKKTALTGTNEEGFVKTIVTTDTATMLYALVDWTMHYRSTVVTNADIIVARQTRSEAHSMLSDYPCVQTDSIITYLEDCHETFLNAIVELQTNDRERYMAKTENYNPKTFGWSQLYSPDALSNRFKSRWNTFVSEFNDNGGETFLADYNEYIRSGRAVKATAA